MRLADTAITLPLLAAAALPLGGCVTFDLGARELIGDTVEAGKGLYRTIRHRRDGTEERRYSHVVPIPDGRTDTEAALDCLGYLRGLADAASDEKAARVRAESTEIVERDGGRAMACTLDAVVASDAR